MSATVHQLPTAGGPPASPRQPPSLNLTQAEVQEAAGGYVRPADQLRELHARGFTRAYIPKVGPRRVVLERGHYEAVIAGKFGHKQEQTTPAQERKPLGIDMAGLKAHFGARKRKQ